MKHIGVHKKRLNEHNPREIAFAETWANENKNSRGSSRLQELMIEKRETPAEGFQKQFSILMSSGAEYVKVHHRVTPRDAEIVATVIQWLGSNVGMAFLHEALLKCGKTIVDRKT